MTFAEINKFISKLSNVTVTEPFGKNKLVYSVNNLMFAIVDKDRTPLLISLRCDPLLSELLRDKYEEVMPGLHLDTRYWNTIILSGQLSEIEVKDLIRHAYLLVESGTATKAS